MGYPSPEPVLLGKFRQCLSELVHVNSLQNFLGVLKVYGAAGTLKILVIHAVVLYSIVGLRGGTPIGHFDALSRGVLKKIPETLSE